MIWQHFTWLDFAVLFLWPLYLYWIVHLRANRLELRIAKLERAMGTGLELSRTFDTLLERVSRLEDRITQWGITE